MVTATESKSAMLSRRFDTSSYLKLMAHILHINRWHTEAFYPDSLTSLPVIVNIV
jgi:hypothetical protein